MIAALKNTRLFSGLLLLAFSLTAACNRGPSGEASAPQPVAVDEELIDNVWHRAKLRGVAFRAVGQEPGWLLEITNGEQILLVLDYGQTRVELPYVEPVVHESERRTEFILTDHDAVVEIRGERCADTMSGEQFETSVRVTVDGRQLEGCGRALF